MAILKVYDLGKDGVNADADPLTLKVSELTRAQNALRDPLATGLSKRPGLQAWSTTVASGAILGGIGVPLQDLTANGLHIVFIGRGTT